MSDDPTRLLIVDDSALYRQTIRNVLRDVPHVTIVGVAKNGIEALEKIGELDPDLLTLDVQMPDMDGVRVLREMKQRRLRSRAIMVSSLTAQGAQVTTDALLEGAFDFILKPSGGDAEVNRQKLRDQLEEKIAAFRQAEGRATTPIGAAESAGARAASLVDASEPALRSRSCRAVLIGASTGGPAALKEVLPTLSAPAPAPILVVQHMPAQYTQSLANRLNEMCALNVVEASDGLQVHTGVVYIAPGGHQMKIVERRGRARVRVTDDPHEHGCRPSVDYLFRSAIDLFDGQALGVILTGMGRDGLKGCEQLKAAGGAVFAQHANGCVVYGMPKAVIEEGLADRVLPLNRMSQAINRYIERGVHA